MLSVGAGLPPVPMKLVARIQAGEYVDMAELLPDRLGVSAGPVTKDDKHSSKPKRRQVTNILEWIQCFGIYVAVLTLKHPGSYGLPSLNCRSVHGVQLRRFRQDAAASANTIWAKIDATRWNKAFTGQARAQLLLLDSQV